MIYPGNQPVVVTPDVNNELFQLCGELDDKTAKSSLTRFLKRNLAITMPLILGINPEPIQTMHLNALFKKNNALFVFSRGGSKSTIAGWYAILKCIFEPKTRVVIASANFRTSRRIFEEIERLLITPEAQLARQCFGAHAYKRNDKFSWSVNGGYICALPLTEETRGERCDVLILDELLLLSPTIINEVLAPFLSSPRDAGYRVKVRKLEDELIKKGIMHPNNKEIFVNAAQMIGLSSASYKSQHLYNMFCDWSHLVENPNEWEVRKKLENPEWVKEERSPTYFVSQLSWEAIPATILNRSFIEDQKRQVSEDSFKREFGADFADGSGGYFSMAKMDACTIPYGQYPHSKVVGENGKKYILSIDANASKALNADYFAMALLELDEERNEAIYVHGYRNVGGEIQDHVRYLYYLMTHFNVQLIVADAANLDSFIDAVNDNSLFKKINKKITYITEYDFNKEGQDYFEMLDKAKKQYSVDLGCMCIRQPFTSEWLMRSNTHLQSSIDHKKIWFASAVSSSSGYIADMFNMELPLDLMFPKNGAPKADDFEETRKLGIRDVIENQDIIIEDTKFQCASIEVKTTARGSQSFDLPRHQSNSTSNNKPRKDNYTALLLANWGVKCYMDLQSTPEPVKKYTMAPFLI